MGRGLPYGVGQGANTWTAGTSAGIISPHTMQVVEVTDPAAAVDRIDARLAEREQSEQERIEKATANTDALLSRYKVMPGRILIAKRRVQTSWDDGGRIAMTDDRIDAMRQYEIWGTVLIVGDGFFTDYGQRIEPDEEWRPGAQVLFNPAGGQEVDLSANGATMPLTLIGFRSVLMVDRGDTMAVAASDAADEMANEGAAV